MINLAKDDKQIFREKTVTCVLILTSQYLQDAPFLVQAEGNTDSFQSFRDLPKDKMSVDRLVWGQLKSYWAEIALGRCS